MTFGACRTPWACLAIIVGLTIPAAGDSAAPIELVHGGRLPGRVIETGDPAVVRVAAEMFAEPIEFVAAAVLQDGEAATAPPRLPGLPGRVGLLTSGAARLLGCLAADADGQLAWQPLGAARPVAFANTAASASIDYVGLDVVGGPGIALSRQGRSGDWTVVDNAPADAKTARPTIDVSVRWNAGRTFLLRDMKITPAATSGAEPLAPMHVTQRIGWDPLSRQIRSWVFSADGGHGEAFWSRDGGSWIARTTAVLPDGSQTASLNVYTYDGKDRCTWQSFHTHTGGEHLPPVNMTMIRKPGSAAK
jgi:hypothetical protein